eukprot:TRINITY_DN68532_c0_g1_i1.p1 TRINITY_DN68532_c0_g1~~TRINITY_DN68532_c0_g1_i1.p1  ORF type:complete len:358 (+),score=26.43 TRINITY_DN68532_c0_g1_i1:55-1128(+)
MQAGLPAQCDGQLGENRTEKESEDSEMNADQPTVSGVATPTLRGRGRGRGRVGRPPGRGRGRGRVGRPPKYPRTDDVHLAKTVVPPAVEMVTPSTPRRVSAPPPLKRICTRSAVAAAALAASASASSAAPILEAPTVPSLWNANGSRAPCALHVMPLDDSTYQAVASLYDSVVHLQPRHLTGILQKSHFGAQTLVARLAGSDCGILSALTFKLHPARRGESEALLEILLCATVPANLGHGIATALCELVFLFARQVHGIQRMITWASADAISYWHKMGAQHYPCGPRETNRLKAGSLNMRNALLMTMDIDDRNAMKFQKAILPKYSIVHIVDGLNKKTWKSRPDKDARLESKEKEGP